MKETHLDQCILKYIRLKIFAMVCIIKIKYALQVDKKNPKRELEMHRFVMNIYPN